jgi:hypothetical protein
MSRTLKRHFLFIAIISGTVAMARSASASSKVHYWRDCSPQKLRKDLLSGPTAVLNPNDGTLGTDGVPTLVEKTIGSGPLSKSYSTNDYLVINVLRWKDPKPAANTQDVDSQHWYVYHNRKWTQEQFAKNNRVFGAKHFWLLFIQLNKTAAFNYETDFTVTVTQKTPAYLTNLFQLTGAFTQLPIRAPEPGTKLSDSDLWDAKSIELDYTTSDVQISPTIAVSKDDTCSALTGTQASGVNNVTIDNEGKSWIDFSVGVPIKKISELNFNADNQVISPEKIDTTNALALLNVYAPKVDIKGTTLTWIPHFITGVAVAHQPLHKVLVGGAWGPYFAQFYIGALFVTDSAPSGTGCSAVVPSVPAGTKLAKRTCPQLSYGLNVPIGGLIQALKKTSSSAK